MSLIKQFHSVCSPWLWLKYEAEILPWKCCAVFLRRSSTVSSASAHSSTSLLPYRWVLWHSAENAFCLTHTYTKFLLDTELNQRQSAAWLWKARATERNRDSCTHLGILFSEEVNEAKTTVGSTNPFLWQADCLQLSKRTEGKTWIQHYLQHLNFY